jgi:phage gp36-like protein
MRYINKDDLLTWIQEPLLNGSITGEDRQPDDTVLDNIESDVIDLVKGYLNGRYKSNEIFDSTPVIRNGILVQIISMTVIYRVIRRNAARKVPEDIHDNYGDAIKLLERIQSGVLTLENIPPVTADDGTTASLVYGNNTNEYFFI